MTEQEKREIKDFLAAKGLSEDAIDGAVSSIAFHENTARLRDSDDVKRGRDIMEFKPNPGKATLTQIGETQTFLGGNDRGLPIYKEDVDMIKKSQPLAKKLAEIQKTAKPQEPVDGKPLSEMTAQERIDNWFAKGEKEEQTLRTLRDAIDEVYDAKPEDLNTGPDTTENIHEVKKTTDEEDRLNRMINDSLLRSRGIIEKSPAVNKDTDGVMWYFDPYSEKASKEEYTADRVSGLIKKDGLIEKDTWKNDDWKSRTIFKDLTEARKDVEEHLSKEGEKEKYSYTNILKRMDDTHTRKNNDYGDAAYQGYKKYGPAYFLVQLHNKLSRLESLTIGNKTQMVKDESIDDTLLDLANYSVMYLESRHRND